MATIKLARQINPANMVWDRIALVEKQEKRIRALIAAGAYNESKQAPTRYVAYKRHSQ